jgi:hypothetical protein
MGKIDLLELRTDLLTIDNHNNSHWFHKVVSDLATLLDFSDNYFEWFEAIPANSEPHSFFIRDEVYEYAVEQSVSYRWNQKRTRGVEYMISTTGYDSLASFLNGEHQRRSLRSNSTLGLKNKIVQLYTLFGCYCCVNAQNSPAPLALAFKLDMIVQEDKIFYLHPGFFYSLVEERMTPPPS